MNSLLLESRNNIIFLKDASKFSSNCQDFIEKLESLSIEKEADINEILTTAAEIYMDLQSFLVNWVLKAHIEKGLLSYDVIEQETGKIASFLEKHNGSEILKNAKKEIEDISHSSIKKMCELELEGKLFTYWGHDYCSGSSHSLRRGARFLTSNPAKINEFRKDFPDVWNGFVEEIKAKHPDLSLERFISYLFLKVVAVNARDFYPIYEATNGKFGFICIQVNPKNWKDSDKMAEEIEFWNEEFKRELNTQNPNIVYKIPAVSAAVKTVDRIVSHGIRVCMTLNFSYSQHDIFSDLIEKGGQNGFVVLMSGFLDDSVEKELASMGIENPGYYSRHAGEAVIRKSYANLKAKGCKKTSIMSAAIRGPYTIKNSISEDADHPMYFTTKTDKIIEFDSETRNLSSAVDEPISDEFLSVLKKSSIFNAAYEKELLTMDHVDEYIPLQWVHGVFTDNYAEIEESLK